MKKSSSILSWISSKIIIAFAFVLLMEIANTQECIFNRLQTFNFSSSTNYVTNRLVDFTVRIVIYKS